MRRQLKLEPGIVFQILCGCFFLIAGLAFFYQLVKEKIVHWTNIQKLAEKLAAQTKAEQLIRLKKR